MDEAGSTTVLRHLGDHRRQRLDVRRVIGVLLSSAVIVSAFMTAPVDAASSGPFVNVTGFRLALGGSPWYLYGAATYGTSNPGGAQSIQAEIALAQQGGLNTLRIVNMFDERGTDPHAPYNESDWSHVDALLAAISAAGLHAILDLSAFRNYLKNRELFIRGTQAIQDGYPTPSSCGGSTGDALARCVGGAWCLENASSCTDPYSADRAADWDTFLSFVANRVNSATGVAYRDDPTIALVSFAGEPDPPNSGEPLRPQTQELTDFYSRVFDQWKSYDPNHLVTSGGLLHVDWEQLYGHPSGIDYQAIWALPNQDVLSIHNYFATLPATSRTDTKTAKIVAAAVAAHKPWITEEFGFPQQPRAGSTTFTEADRATWFDNVIQINREPDQLPGVDTYVSSAGLAFWNLGPEVDPNSHDVNPETPATWSVVRHYAPETTPPTAGPLSFSSNPVPQGDFSTVSVDVADDMSGIDRVRFVVYRVGDDAPDRDAYGQDAAVAHGTATFRLGPSFPPGSYQVRVWAKDFAGNWSDPSSAVLEVQGPVYAVRTIHVPPLASGVAVDPSRQYAYVATWDFYNNGGQVTVVDTQHETVAWNTATGGQGNRIAVNPTTHQVFIARHGYPGDLYDFTTGASMSVGGDIYGIALDPITDRVYAANYYPGRLAIIDGDVDRVVDSVSLPPYPSSVAVDSSRGLVFVGAQDENSHGTITMLSTATHAVIRTLHVGSFPISLVTDPDTGDLWAADINTQRVYVIDEATFTLVDTIDADVSSGIAIDDDTRHVFVGGRSAYPGGPGVVEVIDADTHRMITSVPTVPGGDVLDVAVNSVTGRAYASTYDRLAVIDDPDARPISLPDAPTGLEAVVGDGRVDLSWNAPPSDGGSAIQHYMVYLQDATSGAAGSLRTTETSTTVGGLINGHSYTFTVSATNDVGEGPESPPTGELTPFGKPRPPGTPTATPGDQQVTLNWTAADPNGNAIDGYTVTSSPGGFTATTNGQTSATVTGLHNATAYTFTVTAHNAAGDGTASDPSNEVTPFGEPGPPGTPFAAAGAEQASVSWPAADANGSPIDRYTVTSSPGGFTATTNGDTSATVTGLQNGTAYTFTVVAHNAAGDGQVSAASNSVTPQAGAPPPSSTTETVPPDQPATVSTDTGSGATATDPLTTSVQVPATSGGGTVTVAETTVNEPAPTGWTFLDQQVHIDSTVQTSASAPLRITFTVDQSKLVDQNGQPVGIGDLQVFRTEGGGTPTLVGDCTSESPPTPDPCIPPTSRQTTASGDGMFTVVTSKASEWNLAIAPVQISVKDTGYAPQVATAPMGRSVLWTFKGTRSHSVTDAVKLGPKGTALFDSGAKTSGTFTYRFNQAGTYSYKSSVKGDTMTGTIAVPVLVTPASGTKATTFTIRWSTAALPTGYVEDIQLRFKPTGSSTWKAWSTWKTGQTAATATFVPTSGAGTYQFQSRLRNTGSGAVSGYSSAATIAAS